MKRWLYVVLAGGLMIFGSCLSLSMPKDLTNQYEISFSDSSSCIVIEKVTFDGEGIELYILNVSSQPIELLFRESFMLHNYLEDSIYLSTDRDSFFMLPTAKVVYPHRRYADRFFPKSLGAFDGYRNGGPYISKLNIQGSFSLTLFYTVDGEKQSFTVNFEKLPS
jgi:hypothetical protein